MAQSDVLEILESNKNKWFTTDDIFSRMNISSKSTLSISLRSLRKSGLVNYKKDKNPKRINGSYKHIFFYQNKD